MMRLLILLIVVIISHLVTSLCLNTLMSNIRMIKRIRQIVILIFKKKAPLLEYFISAIIAATLFSFTIRGAIFTGMGMSIVSLILFEKSA